MTHNEYVLVILSRYHYGGVTMYIRSESVGTAHKYAFGTSADLARCNERPAGNHDSCTTYSYTQEELSLVEESRYTKR